MTGSMLSAAPRAINLPKGKAEHVIFIWLGGGMSQIDTFDPKRLGNSKASPKLAGSEYASIDTAVSGVQFCEHLHRTAKLADRLTAMRTVNHHLIDEHAFGTNFVHTGRVTTGSVTYPSIGSIVGHMRGAASEDVPAYMLIGYPNVSRGPGFLGAKEGFVYLVDTESGPAGFSRPEDVTASRLDRRRALLEPLTNRVPENSVVAQY
ncbi:MAG: DUF1501 domain-containing protein, partial [bacterium]|nr:DUF1501 domain-containing protein [bacterium]